MAVLASQALIFSSTLLHSNAQHNRTAVVKGCGPDQHGISWLRSKNVESFARVPQSAQCCRGRPCACVRPVIGAPAPQVISYWPTATSDERRSQLHKHLVPRIHALKTVLLTAAAALLPAVHVAAAVAADEALLTCQEEFGGADPNTVFVIAAVLEFVALTGAATGGILARQRKAELEGINAQLRQINVSLRKQARVESYAPRLSYAPVGGGATSAARLSPPSAVATGVEALPVKTAEAATKVKESEEKQELISRLRAGKRCLRNQRLVDAVGEFEVALVLARKIGHATEEKKTLRGLGASFQRQQKYEDAIQYHEQVIDVSRRTGETSGDTEAYGAIADCYTELGDLEKAAKYYDFYIERLNGSDDGQD